MTDRREDRRVRRLQKLYAEVPKIECQEKCQGVCGMIMMSPLEARQMRLPTVPPQTSACPKLDGEGHCSVYDDRPMICRLYGAAEGLECMHGCKPERMLTRAEASVLIGRALQIGGGDVVCTHDEVFVARRVAEITRGQ